MFVIHATTLMQILQIPVLKINIKEGRKRRGGRGGEGEEGRERRGGRGGEGEEGRERRGGRGGRGRRGVGSNTFRLVSWMMMNTAPLSRVLAYMVFMLIPCTLVLYSRVQS